MILFRLDDASEYMDVEKWNRVEKIFDKYNIKPIVGIIPHNENRKLLSRYKKDDMFWDKARSWKEKGWRIALHGYNHVLIKNLDGIGANNERSEFVGLPLELQKLKIKEGYEILCNEGLMPDMFFAPAHTHDKNTLIALKEESKIRIIIDTIADDVYFDEGFYYVPQQTGQLRKMPFKVTTICLHPNNITDDGFRKLSEFVEKNHMIIKTSNDIVLKNRKRSLFDICLKKCFCIAGGVR